MKSPPSGRRHRFLMHCFPFDSMIRFIESQNKYSGYRFKKNSQIERKIVCDWGFCFVNIDTRLLMPSVLHDVNYSVSPEVT